MSAGSKLQHDISRQDGERLTRRRLIGLAAGLAATAGGGPLWAKGFDLSWTGRTTHVVVRKTERRLYLLSGQTTLAAYDIHLGFAPQGHKERSGDGRTPEGRYWIDRRNARSEYYLSLGISYPNAIDVARSRALGYRPGSDIFIHGEPVRRSERVRKDWTAGCIAVSNAEIEAIWAMVPTGTPITIML